MLMKPQEKNIQAWLFFLVTSIKGKNVQHAFTIIILFRNLTICSLPIHAFSNLLSQHMIIYSHIFTF